MLRRPVESGLDAVVAVMDQPGIGFALLQGHPEGVEDQFSAQVISHGPAHDAPRASIDEYGEVEKALPGA